MVSHGIGRITHCQEGGRISPRLPCYVSSFLLLVKLNLKQFPAKFEKQKLVSASDQRISPLDSLHNWEEYRSKAEGILAQISTFILQISRFLSTIVESFATKRAQSCKEGSWQNPSELDAIPVDCEAELIVRYMEPEFSLQETRDLNQNVIPRNESVESKSAMNNCGVNLFAIENGR